MKVQSRQCIICNKWFELKSHAFKQQVCHDSVCKTKAQLLRLKHWREMHKDYFTNQDPSILHKWKETKKRWQTAHKQYWKQWREKNRERYNEYMREYRNKNKILAIIAGILLIYGNSMLCHGEKIRQIMVSGNINVKSKQIISQVKTKKNEIYSESKVMADVRSILELGYFEDVRIDYSSDTEKLMFIVKEKPLIIKMEFKGNRKISTRTLKSELEVAEKDYMDKFKLGNGINKVIILYKSKGYVDIKVDYDTVLNETKNQVNLVFFVTEGKRVLIGDIFFTGMKKYKEKKLRKMITTKKSKVYDEKVIKEDIILLTKFYKDGGFESVEISEPKISYNEERTYLYITVNVNEGIKYKIDKIEITGNKIYSEKQLMKIIQIKTGQLYNQEKVDNSRMAIGALYADKGYLKAEIKCHLDKNNEKSATGIRFSIVENTIVYVDRIYIDGCHNTKEYVVRREVMLKEGDPLMSTKIRRSIEKIYNLGFLDDATVDIQNTPNPDYADLVFTIVEGKPGMLSAGASYSSMDQLVGNIQLTHMNLFGKAQRLNLLLEYGDRKRNYEIGWTEPWFLSKPMSFGVSVFNLTRAQDINSIYKAYDEQREGGELRLGPRLSDFLSLSFAYSYEKVSVFPTLEGEGAGIKKSVALTSSFTGQFIYDTRDNIFDATRGGRSSLSIQLAGGPFGGDVNFYKPITKTSWFFPTFWKFVFSANLTLGFIEPISPSSNVPLYEGYFVGGAETVRGYQYRQLGPSDGGRFMTIGNIEYKFPIAMENKRTIVQGAFFYDLGGAWKSYENIDLRLGSDNTWNYGGNWDNKLKSGYGFGIRFTTPVFPIRLDWGWPVYPVAGNQPPPQFYFTLGQIF